MKFDLLLPTIVFLVVATSVLSYRKLEKKITFLFEDEKMSTRDAVLIVAVMGVMLTAMVFIPSRVLQIAFIVAYSYMIFSFTYIALRKWYIAVLPPIAFILLYIFYWELLIFNLFVIVFAIIIPVYLGTLFSWKTTCVFAVLLTVLDIVQVFVTGFMGEYATKTIELRLPVILMVPTYPAEALIGLGLGDLFLAGLLAVQTALKQGQRAGILTAATISVAMFVFEVAFFNANLFRFFPATVIVVAGWIMGMAISWRKPRPKIIFEVRVTKGKKVGLET
jgi:presenilin-like A22 family membrane protease